MDSQLLKIRKFLSFHNVKIRSFEKPQFWTFDFLVQDHHSFARNVQQNIVEQHWMLLNQPYIHNKFDY
jgi:hypothetical protein